MSTLNRRVLPLFVLLFLALVVSSPLLAYPVSITINVTFSEIPGDMDNLGLGASGTTTGTITTTLDSATASGTTATYPATVSVTIPALPIGTITETGTVTVTTSGQISAAFSSGGSSFSATLIIPGLTLPTPSASSFGTKSFSAPASSATYNFDSATGTVGITGTISAEGLTATPLTGISVSAVQNGTAPAPQTITVGSNNPATPSIPYVATVSPTSATWLTLMGATGTTPGTVTASFSTSLSPGTYTASVLVDDSLVPTGPITIPITYVVTSSSGGGGGSSLVVSPTSVTFNFFLPSSVSGSQTISVSSTGAAAGYTASVSGASFISVSPTTGTTPGTFTISGNGTGLTNGVYHATVTLTSAVGDATIPITVNVSGGTTGGGGGSQPSPISVGPSTITFNVTPGGAAPPPQTVKLISATPVTFNLGNVAMYLPITPLSGTTPATLTVPLNPAGLTPGTYTDYVQVKSGSTAAQLTVIVNVGVVTLSSTTTSLSYGYPATTALPLTQTLTVTPSVSGAVVPLSVTSSVPWLTATVSGYVVTVTADPTGLAAGTLTGNLVITSSMSSTTLTIPVTFTVVTAALSSVTATPSSLAFAYQIGGTAPATQSLSLTTSSSTATFAPVAVGASWLSVSSSTAGALTVSVNPQNLIAGVYTGSVLVNGTGFLNAPSYVPVTLTVAAGPTFAVSPTTLTFTYQPNGTTVGSQSLAVSSTASDTITATANVPWISIAPASAATPAVFTISVTPGAMNGGSYAGVISFVDSSVPPVTVTVPVELDIQATIAPVLSAITSAESYAVGAQAPGSFITLWGTGMGPGTPTPLVLSNPTTIGTDAGGTQVFADGIPCPILFSSADQVNAILPFSLAGQTTAQMTVMYQGVVSNGFSIGIQASAPGLFALDGSGQGGGAILNSDLSVNTSTNPAPAGSIVVLFGGGAGQTNPNGSDGSIVPTSVSPFPSPATSAVTATVAGQAAQVLYGGDAPGLVSGVLQVNVVIPTGTPSGLQPVVVTIGSASSQANLDVWVQ